MFLHSKQCPKCGRIGWIAAGLWRPIIPETEVTPVAMNDVAPEFNLSKERDIRCQKCGYHEIESPE